MLTTEEILAQYAAANPTVAVAPVAPVAVAPVAPIAPVEPVAVVAAPAFLKVSKVGMSIKASRSEAPYYFIVEFTKMVDKDDTVGPLVVKQAVQFAKTFFVWSDSAWPLEVGTELPTDELTRVFGLKF